LLLLLLLLLFLGGLIPAPIPARSAAAACFVNYSLLLLATSLAALTAAALAAYRY